MKINLENMINSYKIFKESLLDKLEGPSEEEFFDYIKDFKPNDILIKSIDIKFKRGIEYAIENGATTGGLYPQDLLQYYLIMGYSKEQIIKEIGLDSILKTFPKTPEEFIKIMLSDIHPYPKDDSLVGDSIYWGKNDLKLLKVNIYVFVSFEYIWMILKYIYSLSNEKIETMIMDYLHNTIPGFKNLYMINAVHKYFFKWDEQSRKKLIYI